MECYLDNSATTRVDEDVAALMNKIMLEDYGNPSSLHIKGFEAEKYINRAKDIFAGILKCESGEIYFTSGGTESNNTAIIGTAAANRRRGMHMITTRIEHAAVSAPMKFLESLGFRIDYLDVDRNGIADLQQLKELLTPDTILVSVMHVNNEIGSVEPVEEIGQLIHSTVPECLFHVDDIQGFGKLRLIPRNSYIDLLSVSSHKLHGPKGTGLLYISRRSRLSPLIFGGGQQKGMRSGTENVPGIAGFALAAEKINRNIDTAYSGFCSLRESFINGTADIPDLTVNGNGAPYIISLSVKDVRAEVLLHSLEEKNVYVSAGSACSSNKPSVSATLKAIHVPEYALDSTVRISLSPHTTSAEIDYAVKCLHELIPSLRKYTRK